ncbi:MAG TPA: DUF3617 family protein [Xanthobacteraceae bacterium]|nr:DUF3617 family protein [Xanthobacteraceae bacterium]
MNKKIASLVLVLSILLALETPAAAAEMQPGLWRFTQRTQAGGQASQKTTTRCVSAAEAKNPASYFLPTGRGCALQAHSAAGGRIDSTLRCVNEGTVSDLTATVLIPNPTQMSITTAMTSTISGRSVSVSMTGQGQRIGACGGRRG